jgi:sodium-dependent phosphate transporter
MMQLMPVFVLVTIYINLFFILTKGAKNIVSISYEKAAWICAIAGAGSAVVVALVGFPFLNKKIKEYDEYQ